MKSSELFQSIISNNMFEQIEARYIDNLFVLVFHFASAHNNKIELSKELMNHIITTIPYGGRTIIEKEENAFVKKIKLIFADYINIEIDKLALKEDIW